MTSFLDLGVPADLAAVLTKDGKTEAFAIQRDTLPDSPVSYTHLTLPTIYSV